MLEKLCVVVSNQTWINFSFIWMLQQLVRVEKGEWMIKIFRLVETDGCGNIFRV